MSDEIQGGFIYLNGIKYPKTFSDHVKKISYNDYMALSDTDKNKNIMYMIDDAPESELESLTEGVWNTPSSLATFEASEMPMPSLKVSVEAKQDLHGYDHPWVGGAGKNKCYIGTRTISTAGYVINSASINDIGGLPAGTYTVSFDASNFTSGGAFEFILRDSNDQQLSTNSGRLTDTRIYFTTTISDTAVRAFMYTNSSSGVAIGNIQIEQGSTATSYEPYSNECPISGWSEVNVSDVGKNLLTFPYYTTSETISGVPITVNSDGRVIASGTSNAGGNINYQYNNFKLKKGTYTISVTGKHVGAAIRIYDRTTSTVKATLWSSTENAKETFTLTDDITNGMVYANWSSSGTVIDFDCTLQIEKGNEATTYEPYNGVTTTISLGQTVYGAEVDVVNGGGSNTYGYVTENDFLAPSGTNIQGLHYVDVPTTYSLAVVNGQGMSNMLELKNGYIGWNSSTPCFSVGSGGYPTRVYGTFTTLEEFKTEYEGLQIVYELATPTTLTTQPTPIKSLEGINNLSVDCGEVLEVRYANFNPTIIKYKGDTYSSGAISTKAKGADLAETIYQYEDNTNTTYEVLLAGTTGSITQPDKVNKSNKFSFNPNSGGLTIGTRTANTQNKANSIALGDNVEASGNCSFATGGDTAATATYAHAEGYDTVASGTASHAEGNNTAASSAYAHAEGISTTASGNASHAEGDETVASGSYSHAEGYQTEAMNSGAHTEGNNTTASGVNSHAEGLGTIAQKAEQHVFGRYNIADTRAAGYNYAEIVGNGTDSTHRSNARTLDWSGNETLAGNLDIGGDLTVTGFISEDGQYLEDKYQGMLTPGTGISISDDNEISCTGGGGGGSYSVEVLAGDMTATFSTSTPSYALETVTTSLPSGKHFADYDEICVVSIGQQSPSATTPRAYYYERIPAWALQHCDGNYGVTVCTLYAFNGTAGQGTRVCLFPNDSYRNDWYNYASPIAILGIKYN